MSDLGDVDGDDGDADDVCDGDIYECDHEGDHDNDGVDDQTVIMTMMLVMADDDDDN